MGQQESSPYTFSVNPTNTFEVSRRNGHRTILTPRGGGGKQIECISGSLKVEGLRHKRFRNEAEATQIKTMKKRETENLQREEKESEGIPRDGE